MGWVDLGISPGSWWRGDETWHSLYIYNCIMNNYICIYKICLIFFGDAHAIEVHSCARIVLGTNAHMGSCGSLTKQMAWSPGDFTGSILQQIVLISTWFNPNTHQHASRIWESGNISCHPQQDSAACHALRKVRIIWAPWYPPSPTSCFSWPPSHAWWPASTQGGWMSWESDWLPKYDHLYDWNDLAKNDISQNQTPRFSQKSNFFHGLPKVSLHVGTGVVHVLRMGEALPQHITDGTSSWAVLCSSNVVCRTIPALIGAFNGKKSSINVGFSGKPRRRLITGEECWLVWYPYSPKRS